MRARAFLLVSLVALTGCDVAIKNGLFACGQPSDCPSGYFCWSSDNRCYDSKEPQCEAKSCEQVIAEFGALGIPIECGSLPDGCEGSIACGGCTDGEVCGANGQNFLCGCEENTCATFGSGAECGFVPTRCGGQEEAIFCGNCLNAEMACVDNECICPPGQSCDNECAGRCAGEEICVNGECCTPTYPCAQNDCSPPGGLPDGCGGVAHCPPCAGGDQCALGNGLLYECIGDCTCEAEGVECGSATVCGSPRLCGTCTDNGFSEGYRCDSGRCVCEDAFEYNDTFDEFALVCGGGAGGVNCMQDAWSVDLQASLHSDDDVDLYLLEVLDSATPILAQAYNGRSERVVYMTYLCPDGFVGMAGCSGDVQTEQGIEFCTSSDDSVGILRKCDSSASSQVGTILVGVESKEFRGDCDAYRLKITATYGQEIPSF
ncbi:MAG: hypothetical protein AMJ63_06215 [Myxococcales bacterium SG8_38_1]|jgi:hypothetical protein|nr:MAG: hypothetical protein AMJ63_06215 [Myxococcales bacterium SG8_38_1]